MQSITPCDLCVVRWQIFSMAGNNDEFQREASLRTLADVQYGMLK